MPFWLKLLATRSENFFSQPTLERRLSNTVSWSHLDLRGSTWSYTCTSAIVDTGYQSRQESLRICALAVAVVEAQSLSRLPSIIIGVASCSRPTCETYHTPLAVLALAQLVGCLTDVLDPAQRLTESLSWLNAPSASSCLPPCHAWQPKKPWKILKELVT